MEEANAQSINFTAFLVIRSLVLKTEKIPYFIQGLSNWPASRHDSDPLFSEHAGGQTSRDWPGRRDSLRVQAVRPGRQGGYLKGRNAARTDSCRVISIISHTWVHLYSHFFSSKNLTRSWRIPAKGSRRKNLKVFIRSPRQEWVSNKFKARTCWQ